MKAAVLEAIGQPLSIRDIHLPRLKDGQVLVKMRATGICGAQLQEIDGLKGDPAYCPHLLGHEGCGDIDGQKVVVHWRKGEGREAPLPDFDGVKAGPCTTFSEYTVVSENRVTPIPNDVPDDFASLLGCCLSTALALVENEARPSFGDRVLVVGCGGLGLALILALRMFRSLRICAVDLSDEKKKLSESLGSKFTNRLDERNWHHPFDIVIDTIGDAITTAWVKPWTGRYISLQKGGSEGGGFNPSKDIPRYVQMWRDGKLDDYKKLITHRISLDQINEGIALMRQGKAGRVLIEFKQDCPHIPPCFENSSDCWNYDESKRRAMAFPNFP